MNPTSSTGDYIKWHTFESTHTFARGLKTSSTKNLLFPGPLPYFRTDLQYMEIWEPHGSHQVAQPSSQVSGEPGEMITTPGLLS